MTSTFLCFVLNFGVVFSKNGFSTHDQRTEVKMPFMSEISEGWLSTHRTGTHPETTFKQKAMLRDEYFIIDMFGGLPNGCAT